MENKGETGGIERVGEMGERHVRKRRARRIRTTALKGLVRKGNERLRALVVVVGVDQLTVFK